MASTAQILANKQNATQSTGPKTEVGKATSRLNATRHGLTGRTVVLPAEDAQAYARFRQKLTAELSPKSTVEEMLVQTIVETQWRLERARGFETNIMAHAHFEPVPQRIAAIMEPTARTAMIETHAAIKHEKVLRNMQLQEARLQRALFRALEELRAQQARRKAQLAKAVDTKILYEKNNLPFHAEAFGFVFTPAEFSNELTRRKLFSVPANASQTGPRN